MAQRVIKEMVYEYWDCQQCGAKALRGDLESCTACSKRRDKNVSFYRASGAEVLVEAQYKARHEAGADWICEYCQNMSASLAKVCTSCGAERSTKARTDPSDNIRLTIDRTGHEHQTHAEPPRPKSRFIAGFKGSFAGLVLIALAYVVLNWATATEEQSYEITAMQWERHVPVERYVRKSFENWANELRGDDRQVLSEQKKIRSYVKVVDHYKTEPYTESERYQSGTKEVCRQSYESTGSGAGVKTTNCDDVAVYATRQIKKTREVPVYRQDPVYDRWLSYEANVFEHYKTFSSEGNGHSPVWPKVLLGKGHKGVADRTSDRTQSLRLTLKRQNESEKAPDEFQMTTPESRFVNEYRVGQSIKLLYQNFGGLQLGEGEDELRLAH